MVREEWRLASDDWVADASTTVVAVDGSGKDANALLWAATDAARNGADLLVATVVDDGLLVSPHASLAYWKPYADQILDEAVAAIGQLIPEGHLHRLVLAGDPAVEITRRFDRARAVVVGRRGLGAFERVLVGSTSLGVVARSRAPVVVVPDDWDPGRDGRRPVVVGIDPEDDQEAMLALVFARAERLGVPLIAVHALGRRRFRDLPGDEVPAPGHGHDAFEVLMDKWAAAEPVARLCRVTSDGPAAAAILTAGTEAQLLVVGRSRHRLVPGVALGSTLRALLQYADCPVLVVPDPQKKSGDN